MLSSRYVPDGLEHAAHPADEADLLLKNGHAVALGLSLLSLLVLLVLLRLENSLNFLAIEAL